MTDARLGLLGSGRLVVIVWALIQLLGYAFIIAYNGGLSTGPARVMIRPALHLTPSGVVARVAGVAKKIFFQSGRSAYIFIPMVVKLVGQ
jgi:hypothetical protein